MTPKPTGPATTTRALCRKYDACEDGYKKLLGATKDKYGDNDPIPLTLIVETNGIADAIWALRTLGSEWESTIRHFACDCAERVLEVYEANTPDDKRPRQAIEVAREFADGLASAEELAAAWDAARAAARAAAWDAAWAAASDAARAAASDAAWAAAWDAASDAAGAAAWAAAGEAAWAAAGEAARAAAWDAARADEREWQARRFREVFGGQE